MQLEEKITFLLVLIFYSQNVNGDYYTSITSLHDLLEAELHVIKYFEEYMETMEDIGHEVNEALNEIERLSQQANLSTAKSYDNPLDAYQIIRRFVVDWKYVNKTIFDETPALTYISKIKNLVDKESLELPTVEDLVGASKGMARLQQTYRQATRNVADGYLGGTSYAAEMTASECFWLGDSLYQSGNYKYAAEWLLQARMRLAEELSMTNGTHQFGQITDIEVLQSLAPAMHQLGKSSMAAHFNDELLAQDPTNSLALANVPHFAIKALDERYTALLGDTTNEVQQRQQENPPLDELFEKTCNGDLQQTPREKRKLHCRFVHNNVPFRYIAPFKKEELNRDPPVAYYHEIISDAEIESILYETEDFVKRSKIGDSQLQVYSDLRTSQNTWLYFERHPFLKNIAQRLKDITGLTLESGEPLQVANYGIGGHYGPHYDFSEDPNYDYDGRGNRILTALIYINKVAIGGATAFPYLKLAVTPIKGSLVVWDNLHKSLERDYRTKHGGCPVLVGSKWICNEWFHTISQEFKRPCDLKNDAYKSIKYKDLH